MHVVLCEGEILFLTRSGPLGPIYRYRRPPVYLSSPPHSPPPPPPPPPPPCRLRSWTHANGSTSHPTHTSFIPRHLVDYAPCRLRSWTHAYGSTSHPTHTSFIPRRLVDCAPGRTPERLYLSPHPHLTPHRLVDCAERLSLSPPTLTGPNPRRHSRPCQQITACLLAGDGDLLWELQRGPPSI